MARLKGKPLLAEAWTQAASLYFSEVVPRFKPWTLDAIKPLLSRAPLPEGNILVLCCGPGHELLLLNDELKSSHPIIGIDLSPGMVEIANQLILSHTPQAPSSTPAPHKSPGQSSATHEASPTHIPTPPQSQHGDGSFQTPGQFSQPHLRPRMRAVVGDATMISEECLPAAAVLSIFGLQQMTAEANLAVSRWVSALVPGGVASIIYWHPADELDSPWARLNRVAEEHTKAGLASASHHPTPARATSVAQKKSTSASPAAAAGAPPVSAAVAPVSTVPWDTSLVASALAVPGVQLQLDKRIRHPFEWPSLARFWEVMTRGGPWCARRVAFGDAHMDELYVRFAALYAECDGVREGEPLLLAPEARLLVFTKALAQPAHQHLVSHL